MRMSARRVGNFSGNNEDFSAFEIDLILYNLFSFIESYTALNFFLLAKKVKRYKIGPDREISKMAFLYR